MYSAKIFTLSVILLATTAVHGIAVGKLEDNQILTSNNNNNNNNNNGFAVQSGYEGYLLNHQKHPVASNNWLGASKLSILKSILLPASSYLLIYGSKILGVIFHLLITVFLGVAATTAVCSFTPLCTISLAGPGLSIFKGQSVKDQVAELTRNYMTPENLESVSRFVQGALDKYSINQHREVERPEAKVSENETTSNVQQVGALS